MDKNYKRKVKDFFRKEGFYIVLFICLCIIATIGTLAYRKINNSTSETTIENNSQEVAKISGENNQNQAENENKEGKDNKEKDVSTQVPNAERVENTKNKEEANNNTTKQVVSNSDVSFNKPVEGALLRTYTYPKPVKISDIEQRTIAGIDVEAKIGSQVKSAAEGVVEKVGKGSEQEGIAILIKHANGMKTKYCNLGTETLVKEGDKVSAGTAIGSVGNTVKIFGDDYYKEYLNIQVLNANNDQVDPLKYFKYEAKK